MIQTLRPLEQHGELNVYSFVTGKTKRLLVPQPAGFRPKYAWLPYFQNPVLAVNSRGDLLCWWTAEYNGDHSFAGLKQGADTFTVHHASFFLEYPSRVACQANGDWYLVQADPAGFFNIYRIQPDMRLTPLDRIQQSSKLLDARFIADDILRIFCSGREERCIDFDVSAKRALHDSQLRKTEQSIGPASGTVLQGKNGWLHYVWGIEDLTPGASPSVKNPGPLNGLYYQAEANPKMQKIGTGANHRAVAVGDGVAVCWTQEGMPNHVYFRVIRRGVLGPVTELRIGQDRTYNLTSEYMALYADQNRIWFANTLEPNTIYEFKLVDSMEQ